MNTMIFRPLGDAVRSRRALLALILGAGTAVSGCANTPALKALAQRQHRAEAASHHPSEPAVVETSGNYVSASRIGYVSPSDSVSVHADDVPLGQVMRSAMPAGWSLNFEQGIDPRQSVSVDINGMSRQRALRQIALAGGGVIVEHPDSREIIVAQQATYFYVVPSGLLGKDTSNFDVSSSTSISGNGSGAGSTGVGGGGVGGGGGVTPAAGSTPGGSGSSGSSNGASFSVSGGSPKSGLEKALKNLVGKSGSVTIDPTTGQIAITAGAGGLSRADHYLRRYASDAATQIEIHAAILEVDLNESLSTGINWSKLLSSNSAAFALAAAAPSTASVINAANSAATSFTITHTGASLSTVIKALQGVSNVRVMTEPWLSTADGMPATINSGTQVPYVGSVTNDVSGLSGTTTTGSSLSYATDGVALSFVPQIIGTNEVQMAIVPSLSTIQSFQQFQVSGQTLSGPVLQQRQAYVRLMAHPDETEILGGSITRTANTQSNGIPWLSQIPVLGPLFGGYGESHERKQLVILVRTHIVHGDAVDPLVGESL